MIEEWVPSFHEQKLRIATGQIFGQRKNNVEQSVQNFPAILKISSTFRQFQTPNFTMWLQVYIL